MKLKEVLHPNLPTIDRIVEYGAEDTFKAKSLFLLYLFFGKTQR
jgi:hypothetical protein